MSPDSYENLRFEIRPDGVAVVTLDRPPVNALGRDLVAEITTVADHLRENREVRAVVLGAAGKAFCAGADLKERRGMDEAQVEKTVLALRGAVEAFGRLPVPTVAAIQGVAAGGGCELALACDMRVMSADAKIGLPECGLAIIPGAGATQRLPRLIGPARAKKWIFTARMFTADEAREDGVVEVVAPAERVGGEALALAEAIASCGPVAIRSAKRAVEQGLDAGSLAAGLELEWLCYREVIPTEDRLEALAAFAEKRKPAYRGR